MCLIWFGKQLWRCPGESRGNTPLTPLCAFRLSLRRRHCLKSWSSRIIFHGWASSKSKNMKSLIILKQLLAKVMELAVARGDMLVEVDQREIRSYQFCLPLSSAGRLFPPLCLFQKAFIRQWVNSFANVLPGLRRLPLPKPLNALLLGHECEAHWLRHKHGLPRSPSETSLFFSFFSSYTFLKSNSSHSYKHSNEEFGVTESQSMILVGEHLCAML